MAHLIVGGPNCDPNDILTTLQSRGTFTLVRGKWREICIHLRLSMEEQEVISTYVPKGEPLLIMQHILAQWTQKNSNGATLGQFIQALRSAQMNDLAVALEQQFNGSINTSTAGYMNPGSMSYVAAVGGSNFAGPSTTSSVQSQCRLSFQGMDMNQVLNQLIPPLTAAMSNRDVNRRIILQLVSLGLFDNTAVERIQFGQYPVESERMEYLFHIIRGSQQNGIIQCLEKLCNLDDLRVATSTNRDIIRTHFPNSVFEYQ